jgi:hypothetical protein
VNLKITASSVLMLQWEKTVREKKRMIGFMRLERMYRQCCSYDMKTILCAKNAKVGKEILTGIAVGTCDLHDLSSMII